MDYEQDPACGERTKLLTYRDIGNPGAKSMTTWRYDPATGLILQKEDAGSIETTYS